jgi:tetratricopeptide (TPR) repeat protein
MTSTNKVRNPMMIGAMLAVLVLSVLPAFGWQGGISPVSDYQYKKDYAQYETIRKETDPQKRAQLLLAFMKEHPISRMLTYVVADYLDCLKPAIQSKDWAKVVAAEEALQALMPTEKSVRAAQVPEPGAGEFLKNVLPKAEQSIQSALLAAYYQSNNLPKAAALAEKLYAEAPNKNLAAALADIYLKLNNQDKFAVYAEKVIAEVPIEQSYTMMLQLAGIYQQKNNLAKAVEYASKVMAVYGDKVPQGVQESAWNQTRAYAYGLMGISAYANKDYAKTLEYYDKVTKFAPKTEEAWYYIAMSKWQNQDPEGAIAAFAKTVVLNGKLAQKARGYMEELYKARHNDTLDGLDQVLAKAKSDLGIS